MKLDQNRACVHTYIGRRTNNYSGTKLQCIYKYNYYHIAGYKITYSVATLSYDNYYVNLQDYNNSLLSDLL